MTSPHYFERPINDPNHTACSLANRASSSSEFGCEVWNTSNQDSLKRVNNNTLLPSTVSGLVTLGAVRR